MPESGHLPNMGLQWTPLARLLGWARFTRPIRYGLLVTRQPATFRRAQRPNTRGAPAVSRTRIAWQLPPAAVLHPPHGCQRRS